MDRSSRTYRILEGRVAVASLRGPHRALTPHTVVRRDAVETVSVQGYRPAPFPVIEPRLSLSHYKLENNYSRNYIGGSFHSS